MERNRRKSFIYLLVVVVLAVIFLYLAVRGIDWGDVLRVFRRGDYFRLIVASLIVSISYGLRGIRWGILLKGNDAGISFPLVFLANMVGYLGNIFLPARSGEILRAVYVSTHTSISSSYALAVGLTERVLDVVFLTLLGVTASIFWGDMPVWLEQVFMVAGVLILAIFLGIALSHRSMLLLEGIIEKIPLPKHINSALISVAEKFFRGLLAFRKGKSLISFFVLSAFIWFCDASGAVIVASAFELDISLIQAILLLVALGLSSALPSTPGYIGIYQFVAVSLLPLFGFSRQEALGYIIALQGANYLVISILGLLGIWRLGFSVWHKLSLNSTEVAD